MKEQELLKRIEAIESAVNDLIEKSGGICFKQSTYEDNLMHLESRFNEVMDGLREQQQRTLKRGFLKKNILNSKQKEDRMKDKIVKLLERHSELFYDDTNEVIGSVIGNDNYEKLATEIVSLLAESLVANEDALYEQSGSAYGMPLLKNAYEQLRQHFVNASLPLDSEVINNCPQSSYGTREVWMRGVVWLKERVLKGNER